MQSSSRYQGRKFEHKENKEQRQLIERLQQQIEDQELQQKQSINARPTPLRSSGIISGMANVPEQLEEVERAELKERLAPQITSVKKKLSAYLFLLNALKDLNKTLVGLRSPQDVKKKRIDYPDSLNASGRPQFFKAQADYTIGNGPYNFIISTVAQPCKMASQNFSAPSQVLGMGTLMISIGGSAATSSCTMTLDATNNTPDGIVALINSQNCGVQASLVTVNDPNQVGSFIYRILLVSKTSGVINGIFDIETASTSGDLSMLNFANFQQLDPALDTSVSLETMVRTSPSNTITDLLPGLTLIALKADPGNFHVMEVQDELGDLGHKLEDFVDAFNHVKSLIKDYTSYVDRKTRSCLNGDGAALSIEQMLNSILNQTFTTDPVINSLIAIGIMPVQDTSSGKIEFDYDQFETLTYTNYSAITQVISDTLSPIGIQYGFASTLHKSIDACRADTGPLGQAIRNSGNQLRRLEEEYERKELEIDRNSERVRAQFNAMELRVNQQKQRGEGFTHGIEATPIALARKNR